MKVIDVKKALFGARKMSVQTNYNGWKNYETWNVSLCIGNDEGLYHFARGCRDYNHFSEQMIKEFNVPKTPDGIDWDDPNLDIAELDEMIEEL